MISFGGWFGGPLVRFEGEVVDGRKRLDAWRVLMCPGDPPELVADTRKRAGQLLLLAGHVDRAAAILGDAFVYDANTAAMLRVPQEVGALLVAYKRPRRTRPRGAPRRRQVVIDELRRLLLDVTERGRELTPHDLRLVLGDWG